MLVLRDKKHATAAHVNLWPQHTLTLTLRWKGCGYALRGGCLQTGLDLERCPLVRRALQRVGQRLAAFHERHSDHRGALEEHLLPGADPSRLRLCKPTKRSKN